MQRRSIALRIPVDALQVIDQEAQARGLSRTDYIVKASTGTLDETVSETLRRVEKLEQEVDRLGQLSY
jgi:uncharacterized protein (DUF1778 family)